MRYRVTCLTPTLIGDGASLAPIDYMVWKDQVNVLNQDKIFELLAKGPRLDGYLSQIKRADKLDFANWGGFAQNFAGRRIAFEHPSAAQNWEAFRAEQLFISTFVSQAGKPYLPGSALRGALRTALLASRVKPAALENLGDYPSAKGLETQFLGKPATDALRTISLSDSQPLSSGRTLVYQVKVATIELRGPGILSPGWKQQPRGVNFAEMASPGARFEGEFAERPARQGRPMSPATLAAAANSFSAAALAKHALYAKACRLTRLEQSLTGIQARLQSLAPTACILPIGWGTGYFGKAVSPYTEETKLREALGKLPYYQRAIRSGLPFPKTRRVVMLANEPAALPGWVEVDFAA
jgi:CRISPR-associated protein Csm5